MRARRPSNDGARLLFGKAAFLRNVFALPAAASEASLPILAAFREAPGRTALRLGAKALAGLEPFGATFCVRRRAQRQNQRSNRAELRAHKRKLSQICLPHQLNTLANAKPCERLFATRGWKLAR
jgi:hypothetical protein